MELRLKISDDMSKSQEARILVRLADAFRHHPNNYLRELFSDEFVGWAVNRMRDDFPVNVMEYVVSPLTEDDINKLRQEVARVADAASFAEADAKKFKDLAYERTTIIAEKKEEIHALLGEIDAKNKTMAELMEQLEIHKKLLGKSNKEFDEMEEGRLNAEYELLKLKAKFFDYMTKGEKEDAGN